MIIFLRLCSAFMSGLFGRFVWGCWHVARIALRMLWWIFSWCFHVFCSVLGRKPPWIFARLGSGGAGLVIHMSSMHWLRMFVISWSLFCASSHWSCVSVSCSRVVVRLSIARFCVSKKVVWSF